MAAALPVADGTVMFPFLIKHGLSDPAMLKELEGRRSYYPKLVPSVPQTYIRMHDEQQFRIGEHQWRIITGFGHSPEHAALYCAELNVMISGDKIGRAHV